MKLDKHKISGFRVFWVQYEDRSSDRHQLFVKEHSLRRQEPQRPKGRTLFALNVPPYVVEESLKIAFAEACGPVQSVAFAPRAQESQNGFKSCYVVFEDESGLDKALLLREHYVLSLPSVKDSPTGLSKWCQVYNDSVCDEETTHEEIEEYMRSYDRRVADRLTEESTRAEGRGDEDGWVTVSGKKKRGQRALIRTETAIGNVRRKQAASNEKKQLLNFYTFQIRESKKQNLTELRKKFQQDKDKLQQLKMKRTFKPF